MALSKINYVLLTLAAALLVTGAVVMVRYLIDPVPQDKSVSASVAVTGAGSAAPAPAAQSWSETSPTQVTVRPTPLPTPVQIVATPLPPATPNVVAASLSTAPPASNSEAGEVTTGTSEASKVTNNAEPGAPVPVAEAMAPLGDSFVVAWHYIDATDEFVFYDPELLEESNLKAMASGQTYLIKVDESVTVVIDGKELAFVCDEKTCWNTVVWP